MRWIHTRTGGEDTSFGNETSGGASSVTRQVPLAHSGASAKGSVAGSVGSAPSIGCGAATVGVGGGEGVGAIVGAGVSETGAGGAGTTTGGTAEDRAPHAHTSATETTSERMREWYQEFTGR